MSLESPSVTDDARDEPEPRSDGEPVVGNDTDYRAADAASIVADALTKRYDETLVFDSPDVQKMDAQGQETYNIVGSPRTEEASELSSGDGDAGSDDEIPQEDIETVADRAGVSEDEAREALEATDGMPLDAIEHLSE